MTNNTLLFGTPPDQTVTEEDEMTKNRAVFCSETSPITVSKCGNIGKSQAGRSLHRKKNKDNP